MPFYIPNEYPINDLLKCDETLLSDLINRYATNELQDYNWTMSDKILVFPMAIYCFCHLNDTNKTLSQMCSKDAEDISRMITFASEFIKEKFTSLVKQYFFNGTELKTLPEIVRLLVDAYGFYYTFMLFKKSVVWLVNLRKDYEDGRMG